MGESGSGKSMTARTIAGVLPRGALAEGELLLGGENLLAMPHRKRRDIQAKEIGVIFQDPRAYIDPLWRVEVHMTEAMRVHLGLSRSESRARAVELLDSVGIDQPERRMRQFPDELSGGMLQRVMIAGALAVGPSVLLADEATTALDVTTQAEIVKLLGELSSRRVSRCSSSPTTWPWPTSSAAGSVSCTRAGLWRCGKDARSSRTPSTPTRSTSSPPDRRSSTEWNASR